jgi:aspartate/methionine/tyrosine aminotransferase
MIQLNKNILQLKPSATLAINQKVKELREKGEIVFHFGFGQSPFKIHYSITEELKKHVDNNNYLPSIGLPELKVEISKFLWQYQGLKFNSESIFIGPGSKELLFQMIYLLEGVFLIPQGSWVSYLPQVKSKNAEFKIVDTDYNNDFKLNYNDLEITCKNFRDVQKTLILNSPNNPTGSVYSDVELRAIAKICKKYDILVLSDEIYSQLNFNQQYSPSISKYYSVKTIVFGGLSKVFSAGGYRLGYVAVPSELNEIHKPLKSFFSETFSAVSSPIQYAAIKAFEMNDDLQSYIVNCKIILHEISSFIYKELSNVNLECTNPSGGFYMMIGFNKFTERINKLGISTSKELANYLLENYQIALLPASDFYFNQNELFFRLAFVDFDGDTVYKQYLKNGNININFIKEYVPNIYKGIKAIKNFLTKI